MKHDRIEQEDVNKGLKAFSNDLVSEINLEIRDVFPAAKYALYLLIETGETISSGDLEKVLQDKVVTLDMREEIVDVLLWHGVLGVVWPDGRVEYIFDSSYNLRLLKAQREKLRQSGLVYQINPVFWPALLGH